MGVKTAHLQDFMALFDAIVCGSDPEVKEGKPSPDTFLAARERLGNPPLEQCLVFEDSPTGVQAGRNSGMKVLHAGPCCRSAQHASWLLGGLGGRPQLQ
jgi:HAD superfamily hydrolase (TIGR01509 family)